MANVYNINADGGIRVPLIAGSPATLTNGLIWYTTTANNKTMKAVQKLY